MEYEWKPKEGSPFTGFIKIKIPPIKEQFALLRVFAIKQVDGKMSFSDQIDAMEKNIEICGKYVLDVSLEHESGKKIKSYDDMVFYKQSRDLIISEIASILMNGVDLGK